MTILYVIIFIMACVILFQYAQKKNESKNLRYIKDKLSSIIKDKTDEKVLIVDADKEMSELLVEINKFIDFNQKVLADYSEKEISMRKMLSNISHDLKTPLTVVLGYIETIKLEPDLKSEEKEILLSRAHDKTLEIVKLINKFFDLSKLESGDKDISITRINISEVCRKSILNYYETLNSKGIEVNIDIPELNIYAMGNEEALDRVLSNLISNAIKYGSDGKIIGLKLRYDEEFVYVDIWDKGKGIEEKEQDKVFERLYTLEDSRNKYYEGSGLGLTITKRLVERMGGEIILESKPYEKTTFTFKLIRVTY
jgi:signal transduction histidine kinase